MGAPTFLTNGVLRKMRAAVCIEELTKDFHIFSVSQNTALSPFGLLRQDRLPLAQACFGIISRKRRRQWHKFPGFTGAASS